MTKSKSNKWANYLHQSRDILSRVWDQARDWIKILFIILACLFGLIIILLFFLWFFFGRSPLVPPDEIVWGTTYSALAAEELGLDPKETYKAIVEDLKPQRLRLVAYWNRIESEQGIYDFSELDYQVELAEKHDIPYIIAVGQRVPRYPECHIPAWANSVDEKLKQQKLLDFIETTIRRYDDKDYQLFWQVENEPYVEIFGQCPALNEEFFNSEIDLARSITNKSILVTESGELSVWLKASNKADVLGSTLYRTVVVGKSGLVVRHIYPAWYYRARSNVIKKIRPNIIEVIVAELQGEPWSTQPIINTSKSELERTMNRTQFEKNIAFTESVGFPEVYWWGAEWWYKEKTEGNPYYWNRAKTLFRSE